MGRCPGVEDDTEVVHYEADDIYFSVDSGLGFLTGQAKVVSGSMELTAHRIVLRLYDNEVCVWHQRQLGPVGWAAPVQRRRTGRSANVDELVGN